LQQQEAELASSCRSSNSKYAQLRPCETGSAACLSTILIAEAVSNCLAVSVVAPPNLFCFFPLSPAYAGAGGLALMEAVHGTANDIAGKIWPTQQRCLSLSVLT
jgi:hypothetical protein